MQHVSLEEELCNVVIENLAARWRHGGSGDDALGSRQSLRRQQGCAVMCGPQWEMHFSTLYLLILMTKSSHAHRGFYAATSATTFLLFSWQQQTWCVCFHSVTKQNKTKKPVVIQQEEMKKIHPAVPASCYMMIWKRKKLTVTSHQFKMSQRDAFSLKYLYSKNTTRFVQ